MHMGRRLPSSRLEVWLTGILNSLSISKQSQQFISAVSSSSEGSRFGRILVPGKAHSRRRTGGTTRACNAALGNTAVNDALARVRTHALVH